MKKKNDDKGQLNSTDSDSLVHYLNIEDIHSDNKDDAEKKVQHFKL